MHEVTSEDDCNLHSISLNFLLPPYLLPQFKELLLEHGLVFVVQSSPCHVRLELVQQRLPVADIHSHTPLQLGLDLGLDG